MQQVSRKAEPGDYKHAVNDMIINEVANVSVTVCLLKFIFLLKVSHVGAVFEKLINRPIEA